VARRGRELDDFDIVEGLVIRGGPQIEVLNGISLHGGLVASWPRGESVTAAFVVECRVGHWRQFGLPGYAHFDNDTVFQGPNVHPDTIGRVSRLRLGLGAIPVFVPSRRHRRRQVVVMGIAPPPRHQPAPRAARKIGRRA
jgi:hypothetical protein